MAEYLFPNRLTRRDFFRWSGAAGMAAGFANAGACAAGAKAPVTYGSGRHTYTLDEQWGKLPRGMNYGYGCAVVADARDRVYVTMRSTNPSVAIFDQDGTLLEAWGNEFAPRVGLQNPEQVLLTAHGLYWSK